ncbi:MAG: FtsX-like permease family protein [Candidatus Microsaccharimonas sp.]
MRTIDIINRAARSLRNAKARTVLTSLAIAVGAFTITISLAAGEGARQYANNLINSNVNPQALFIVKDDALFGGPTSQSSIREYDPDASATSQGITIKQMTQEDVDTLAARKELTSVVPTYQPTVQYITFGDSAKKFSADVSSYNSTVISGVAQGTLPPQGTEIEDDEAVLPSAYADFLVEQKIANSPADLIGRKVVMTVAQATATPSEEDITAAFVAGGQAAVQSLLSPKTKQFSLTVRAISEKSAEALTSTTSIQIAPNAARAISEFSTEGTSQYQKYVGVTAVVKDGYDPAEVKETLQREDGYFPQTAKDLQSVIFTVVNTLQGIVLGFGIIALIASVFGIINTQYISVLERTREIGLMKALGMRGSSVSRLFQFEAAWIGFLGGVIGAAVAVILGLILNPIITSVLNLSDGTSLLIFKPIPIIVMIAVLIIIAMLAGWFPARKAAKLDPIEALRTE